MEAIPVFKPLLEAEEFAAAHAAIDLGWLGMGSYVSQFETALWNLMERPDRHVVAVSTGHAALHLALLLAGIGPGDEVITPSFNNVADFQAIIATGAEPVFCDILEDTLCIDPAKAEALVGPRTKAVIAMDYACHLCEHDAMQALAARYGLRLIHDAAHALGSTYRGKAVGGFSDISVFSFDPIKTVTSIDGGAVVVKTAEEVEILREMRLIGMGQPSIVMYTNQRAPMYDVRRLGFRYHMANLHAAIGVSQTAKFSLIARSRRRSFDRYNEQLGNLVGVITPDVDLSQVVPFIYYLRITGGRRDYFMERLKALGVDTGIHWQAGHRFSLFKNCRRGDLAVTERISGEIVTMPFYSNMDDAVQDRVVDAVRASC
jgi:dTDP-4-amino-4,6-dideoxygalactose transaminase